MPNGSNAQQITANNQSPFPYQLSSYREAALMLFGTGLLYTSAFTQRNLLPMDSDQISILDPENVPFFDRKTTQKWNPKKNVMREFLEPAGIVAAIGVIGGIGLQEKVTNYSWYPLMTLTMMYFEGFYVAEGGVLLMKSITKRPRPFTYNPELSTDQKTSSGNNESFFSGNATVLFFNATFISQVLSDVFHDSKWTPYIWAGSHGIALLSGFWSIQSGMHFPSDVLAGALWGSGIAYLATKLHNFRNSPIKVSPYLTEYGKGITLNLNLSQ